MAEAVLEAEGLGKRYRGFELSGVSFRLEAGTVMGLIGPNGAGKTTTIRMLLGLARPDSGRARLFGEDPSRRGASLMERVGFVFEDGSFYGTLSARDNGRWLGRVYRAWDAPRYGELLGRFGVDPDKPADRLSKGQRMKMALAAALSHGADLLVLDEPTSGLDPSNARTVREIIRERAAAGAAVFLTTHDMAAADAACDRVAFLVDGRIAACDSPAALKRRYGRRAVVVEREAPERDGPPVLSPEFSLDGLADDESFRAELRKPGLLGVRTLDSSLDRIFLQLTGRELA